MRLGYVCADPGIPIFGSKGGSIHVQEVVRALARRGVEVEIHASRAGGEPPRDLAHLATFPLPRPPAGDRGGRELAMVAANDALWNSLARRPAYDVIYERHSLWGTAGMEFARSTQRPGILEVNAPLVEEQSTHRGLVHRDLAERSVARACTAAQLLIAVSEGVATSLRHIDGVGERVHVVSNGVDPARFPSPTSQRRSRPSDTFTVGFLGTLKPWHGLDTLVEGFAILQRRRPASRLLIVGDGPERERLLDQLRSRGLLDATHLCGAVSADEVPKWLASMDAGVAPYPETQGFYFSPLKVLEYMAAGVPTVASRIGQIPECVEHECSGLLFPPGDAEALASALETLADDPDLGSRLGRNARSVIVERHTWDSVVQRILELARLSEPCPANDLAL
jgi:glycosyltransferase involved in cell wall biosynthesis